jgi:A/G-specific adenine glycosylase
LDEVLHHWTGLGYYARGRNLHQAARAVVERHDGRFPEDVESLARLPGIGRSTAGAIAAIGFGRRAAILDGNVKRVLARFHAVSGYPGDSGPLKTLWGYADEHTPDRRVAEYTQAIMDVGATLCTRSRPRCSDCPVRQRCTALAQHAVAQFPGRRAQRDKPVRAARMFVVTDPDGLCLLEQRPPQGLWGGLWTPPERPANTTASALCGEFQIPEADVETRRLGPGFRHTFTHFHLDIEPVYLTLSRHVASVADGANVCWYATGADGNRPPLGLAAPAVRLLASVGAIARSTDTSSAHAAGSAANLPPRNRKYHVTRTVRCRKYAREMEGLDAPPLPGPKGQEIFESVSRQAWDEWQALQTMLINEKHLNLRDPGARKYLSEQRERFLDNEPVDRAEGYVPPESRS